MEKKLWTIIVFARANFSKIGYGNKEKVQQTKKAKQRRENNMMSFKKTTIEKTITKYEKQEKRKSYQKVK